MPDQQHAPSISAARFIRYAANMEAKEKTLNRDPHTLSDRELLEHIAHRVDEIRVYAGDTAADIAIQRKQLDHLDVMVHEVHQFIEEHRPALAKALAFLDPGKSVRAFMKDRKKASHGE